MPTKKTDPKPAPDESLLADIDALIDSIDAALERDENASGAEEPARDKDDRP